MQNLAQFWTTLNFNSEYLLEWIKIFEIGQVPNRPRFLLQVWWTLVQ